nr:uncharacterized protein LOC118080190 [Zootoca vivipara]
MGVLLRWPPLILWAAAHLLLLDCAGSTSHSLRYFFTAVSEPGQGLPQFITVGYVDDQQFVQYDSDTKKALPHVPWIRKAKKQDPYYWEKSMQHFQGAEDVLGLNLETLQYRFNQSEGFYSLQEMLGCDLSSDGRKGGYWQFGYDGRDFIAFDKETLTWTAANAQAQVTKEKWDPIKEQNQYRKAYLEEECIEWLQRYLDYGKETLLRTEAPVVKVTRKADYDSQETLVCQIHGFYPKEIDANWVKDGEVWQEGTLRGLVAPNSDGTYYRVSHIIRHRLMFISLKKISLWLIFGGCLFYCYYKYVNLGLIVGAILGVLIAIQLVSVIIFFIRRNQSEKLAYKAALTSDQGSDSSTRGLQFMRLVAWSPQPSRRSDPLRGRERVSEQRREKDAAIVRGGKRSFVWGEIMGVLLRWPPLILWAAAHLLLLDCAGSTSHSLRYFGTALSEPDQGLPQFIAVGYVDDQQFVQYDSDTKKMLPRVPWIRKVEKEDPQYWDRNTQNAQGDEHRYREDLEIERNRYNQSGGIHTYQMMLGCELMSDGRKRGYRQYSYDGRDFIALDMETLTWTAADTEAQVIKRKWDAELAQNQYLKAYLEEECIEWLQRYLDYGNETLLRTEAPVVKVTRKADYDSQETLVCQVHGFYPKEIDANWVKDGEVWQEGTSRGLVAPNSDGTYYVLLSVKIDPEERDRFRCRVEHDSLEKPLDVAWEKEPVNLGLIVGAILFVLTAILLVSGIIFFFIRSK